MLLHWSFEIIKPRLTMTLTGDECRRLLSRYEEALGSRGENKKAKDNKLLSLDSWRLNTLPSIVSERSPPHMTLEELEKLMDCKMYNAPI